jgi:hypothetical protein
MDLDPVFVDGSGRRRLALRWSGIFAAGILAAFLLVVGSTLITKVTVPRAELPRTAGQSDAPRHTHAPHRRDGR